MAVEVTVPHVGESIQEVTVVEWLKHEGDQVRMGDPLCVLETDKVTLEVTAAADGLLRIRVQAGATAPVGSVLGAIEPAGDKAAPTAATAAQSPATKPAPAAAPAPAAEEKVPEAGAAPAADKESPEAASAEPAPAAGQPPVQSVPPSSPPEAADEAAGAAQQAPAVRRLLAEHGLDPAAIRGTGPGGRLTKGDVLLALEQAPPPGGQAPIEPPPTSPGEQRRPMSPLRKRIAARLVQARQETALVTTFNEIDMDRVMAIRGEYKQRFQEKHQVALGYMSFFVKACSLALLEYPELNGRIEGDDIVYPGAHHIGVAVGSGRGLVVPVIRHAEQLDFAAIERAIAAFVDKIDANRLELSDLADGTFTISNGGVYGSLLSTPLLNLPQSGILGMHKIEQRPVVKDGQIVIRPMMYAALSYDHRIVDGREGVGFLVRVKELIEHPERMLLGV